METQSIFVKSARGMSIIALLFVMTLMSAPAAFCQPYFGFFNGGMAINSSTINPIPALSAIVDLQSGNKGLLIPRVSLSGPGDITTIASPAVSLMVYNLNSTIDGAQGICYWNGSTWLRLSTGKPLTWLTSGNVALATDFLGTTNPMALVIKTANTEKMRITDLGQVGIGTIAPLAGVKLDVSGTIRSSSLTGTAPDPMHVVQADINGKLQNFSNTGYLSGDVMTLVGIVPTWVTPSAGFGTLDWHVFGNAGTNENFNFVGTNFALLAINKQTLNFRVDGQKAGHIDWSSAKANTFFGFRAGWFNTLIVANTGKRNTAFGYDALYSNKIGNNNTANGYLALQSNLVSNNTAVGSSALLANKYWEQNVAVGAEALYFQIGIGTSVWPSDNVAVGYQALMSNQPTLSSNGIHNTAIGSQTLAANLTGHENTAIGYKALYSNTASYNTATGASALESNTTGNNNTANGYWALRLNKEGYSNTAVGATSLTNNYGSSSGLGSQNTAVGFAALGSNTTGANNTALGVGALSIVVSGIENIAIGVASGPIGGTAASISGTISIGTSGVYNSNETHIGNIFSTVMGSTACIVYCDNTGLLGVQCSAKRFKKDILDMGSVSSDLFRLRPVTFHYKDEFAHGDSTLQFGLIAEEVEKVNPNLVVYDATGKIYSVKYHMLTPLMLNELQKAHALNDDQSALIKQLQVQLNDMKARNAKLKAEKTVITHSLDLLQSQLQLFSERMETSVSSDLKHSSLQTDATVVAKR